jgi:hypothetical protein
MTSKSLHDRYEKALAQTKKKLASVDFLRGRPVSIKAGLRGWVFEQLVRSLLEEEFETRGLNPEISEQQSIGGRARVDLVIGRLAIELKSSGFYSDVESQYAEYRRRVEEKGWEYFYLTLDEAYAPYIKSARRVFGAKRAFFLNKSGEWRRFVAEVVLALKKKGRTRR